MSQGPNEIPAGTQCRAASLLHPQHLAASLPINPPPPHFPTHLLTDVLQAGGDHFKQFSWQDMQDGDITPAYGFL